MKTELLVFALRKIGSDEVVYQKACCSKKALEGWPGYELLGNTTQEHFISEADHQEMFKKLAKQAWFKEKI